jgi:hypothetical protein
MWRAVVRGDQWGVADAWQYVHSAAAAVHSCNEWRLCLTERAATCAHAHGQVLLVVLTQVAVLTTARTRSTTVQIAAVQYSECPEC